VQCSTDLAGATIRLQASVIVSGDVWGPVVVCRSRCVVLRWLVWRCLQLLLSNAAAGHVVGGSRGSYASRWLSQSK
jgi:hypothetical protein